jgi:hypothetical protein
LFFLRFHSFTTVLLPLVPEPYISRTLFNTLAMKESGAQPAQKDAATIPDSKTKPVISQQSTTSNKRPLSKGDKNASTEDEPLAKRRLAATPNGWKVCLNPVVIPDVDHSRFRNYLSGLEAGGFYDGEGDPRWYDDDREEASENAIRKIRGDPRVDPKKVGKEQARQNTTDYLENNEFHFMLWKTF